MGFPRSEDAVSLQAQIAEIKAAASRVHSSSPSELFGIVSQVAKRLEHCLKILIYALANAAFHMPAEQLVKERRWLDTSKELEKASLGALLDIVLKIDTAFREGGGVQGFRDDFTIVCLLPDDIRDRCQKIPALRNSFTHVTKSPHPPETPQQRALRFFNEVVALLECLRDRKTSLGEKISLFPIVIRVVGLHFDEYGRKTVTAVTDGTTNWRISSRKTTRSRFRGPSRWRSHCQERRATFASMPRATGTLRSDCPLPRKDVFGQTDKWSSNSSVGLEPEELAAGGDGTGVGTGGTWDVGKCAAGRWASLQRISRICPTQGHRVTDPLNI